MRRALAACIERAGAARSAPRGEELDRLAESLRQGRTVTLGGALFRPKGAGLRITPEPPRR